MKKTVFTMLVACVATFAPKSVDAANLYFDLNGTSAGSGTANGGSYSWEGNFWATGSSGTLATSAWSEGNFPEFSAGTDNTTGSYTVTAGSAHTIVGAFQRTSSGTVTVAGAALTIDPTGGVTPGQVAGGPQQGFFSSGITKFTAKLTGTGGISSQSGQIALENTANDYQGGTTVNGGLVNFSGACFGSSNIFVRANGGAIIAEATGITVPNNVTVIGGSAVNCSSTGTSFATTYSGNWDLGGFTEAIGVGGGTGNSVTITGIISNGGLGRQVSISHGTLFLAGANTYAGKTTIDSSITKVTSLNSVTGGSASSSLGHPTTVANGTIGFGAGSTNGTLLYVGNGETTDRVIDLQAASGGATIDQSGTGLLKFTSSMTATGVGSKTLTFQGSTAGTGEFAGVIVDNGTTGTTVTTATAASGATSLTLGSVDGIVVGASVSGTSIAAGTTVLGVTNSTDKITLSAATTAAITSGATITIPNVKNRTSVAKSGSGTWTLSGVNTYTGNTTNNSGGGTLNLANASALGSGTYVQAGNSQFDNTSGGDMTIANAFNLSGGSPTYVGSANNITITGPVTLISANRTITVSANTVTIANGIGQDASNRNFTKDGNGTLLLQGTSTYAGTTTVKGGKLQVDGSIAASSAVTVNTGATLAGNGVVSGVTVNGTISPGASPGSLTTGAETWVGGGNYVWEINDFGGTVGNNWDIIQAASLNITATTGSKFNIKVTSLSGTSAGQAANFDGNTDYDVTILQTTGGITGNGVAAINVDTSAFQNALGNGGFFFVSIANGGNDLVLSYRRAAFITSSPTSAALASGATANFSGSATASGSVSYQWQKNGVNVSDGSQPGGAVVSGATTGALTVAGVTYQDEGAYTLVATGTYGASATSSAATLTVTDPPIITNPSSDSTIVVDAGTNVNLVLTQTGRTGTYQWKKGAGNLSDGDFDNAATVAGSATANLTLTSVRAADGGVYSITVTTTDGNATSANTTLIVNDPAIAVQPANSTFECGSSNALTVTAYGTTNANGVLTYQWYTPDPSGTAITDATNSFLSFPTVSFANGGSYSVVVSNAFGNSITSSVAIVTIEDTNGPAITVNTGTDTVECHGSFTDAGATATDSCDGAVSVTESGSVDVNTTGFYTLTYAATDSHGNTSTATRVVTVQDTTAPTIALLGSAEITISCGTPYSDAGATASDVCAGDLTSQISVDLGGLNAGNPTGGDYTISYNVQDPSSNAATTVTRVVHVIDNIPPVITVTGANPATVECHSAYTDAGATASDACAGAVTPTTSGTVDANTAGTYTLTYTATDGVNTSTATRVVNVTDTTAPVITLNGNAAVTNECHTAYTDPGASASDDCDANASVTTSGTVDLDTVGVYTRTYTATDATGNTSTTTRQITVKDTTAPVITVTGGDQTVECHTSYTDASATAADACDSNPSVNSSGSVDANTVGAYTITYSSTDASGNTSTATRIVTVSDSTAPVVTLTGAASVTVECHGSFSDPGATASDTCDANPNVSTSGVVDANTPGLYTLTYTATDATGNTSSATRTVAVSDSAAPIISLNGSASMNIECHSSFTDPGATAADACEGAVSVNTTGSVDANTVGDYTLTYTACDSGSHCSSATRVVHVADSGAPVVTLNGTASMTVECHGSFTDPGATAADDCDAGPSVVTSGTVDANTVGSYTLTYTATDATGNTSTSSRVVTVSDTAAPVITVTGGDQTVECHAAFTDSGATAADTCEGDLSANITVIGTVDANTVGVYTLTYSVDDSSANHASATRTVTVQDTTPPAINLVGSNGEIACQFSTYTDSGATAFDVCSGSVVVNTSGTVDTSTAGDYTLTYTATDTAGNVATATRVVSVTPCSAAITQQPQDVTVDANSPFTLSVTAVGPNLTYQWKQDGNAIVDATNSTFTLDNAFRTNAGSYSVDVTSTGVNTVTSSNAVVTVIDPVFTVNPTSATLTMGQVTNYTLTAVAQGTPALKYQWYSIIGSNVHKLASTTSNLNVKVALAATGTYFCVVSNVGHVYTNVSSMATLTVYQPAKVTKPAPKSVVVGQSAIFKVNGTSVSGPIAYQWGLSDINNSFVPLTEGAKYIGTATPTLTVTDAQTTDDTANTGLSFRCQVSNLSASNVLSAPASLTVLPDTHAPVVNIVAPKDKAYVYTTNSSTVDVTGTAVDKGAIASVWLVNTNHDTVDTFSVTNIGYGVKANGLVNHGKALWTNSVTLVDGTNTLVAYAMHEDSTAPTTAASPKHVVYLLDPAPFTVAVTGPGMVTGTSGGKFGTPSASTTLFVNFGYKITAKPQTGKHFLGWFDQNDNPYPGPTANTNKVLTFTVSTTNGLSLKANFQ